jgi:hypothetical protein
MKWNVKAITEIDIELLHPHPQHKNIYFNTQADDLVASILQKGLIERLKIVPIYAPYRKNSIPQLKEHFFILSGVRRHKALKLLDYQKVPCEILAFENIEDEIEYLLVENQQRQKTKFEIAKEKFLWRKLEIQRLKLLVQQSLEPQQKKTNILYPQRKISEIRKKYAQLYPAFFVIQKVDFLRWNRKEHIANLIIEVFNQKGVTAAFYLAKCPEELILQITPEVLKMTKKQPIVLFIESYHKLYIERQSQQQLKKENLYQLKLINNNPNPTANFTPNPNPNTNVPLIQYIPNFDIPKENIYTDIPKKIHPPLPPANLIFFDAQQYQLDPNLLFQFLNAPNYPYCLIRLPNTLAHITALFENHNIIYQIITLAFKEPIHPIADRWFSVKTMRFAFLNPAKNIFLNNKAVDLYEAPIAMPQKKHFYFRYLEPFFESIMPKKSVIFHYMPIHNFYFNVSLEMDYQYACATFNYTLYQYILRFQQKLQHKAN